MLSLQGPISFTRRGRLRDPRRSAQSRFLVNRAAAPDHPSWSTPTTRWHSPTSPRGLGARRDRGVVAGMAQHLLLRHAEKGGDLHRLGQLHVPLALQHARDRRGGEPQLAGEVGLAGAGAFQRLLEPHRIHDGGSVIALLTLLDRIIYRSCVFCKGEQRWEDMTATRPDGIAGWRSMAAPTFSTAHRPARAARPSAACPAAPAQIIDQNLMCSVICT